jgi:hypothetical protein
LLDGPAPNWSSEVPSRHFSSQFPGMPGDLSAGEHSC